MQEHNNDKEFEYFDADMMICEVFKFLMATYKLWGVVKLLFIHTYQKGANNKEKCNDGNGGDNQLPIPREGGEPIQSHLTSIF